MYKFVSRLMIPALIGGCTLVSANAVNAHAATDDARTACGAYQRGDDWIVLSSEQNHTFLNIAGKVLPCGNGYTGASNDFGAVKIEVKHGVPDWADAATCISKTFSRDHDGPTHSGRNLLYSYNYGIAQSIVITSGDGKKIISAYQSGKPGESQSSMEAKWRDCVRSDYI